MQQAGKQANNVASEPCALKVKVVRVIEFLLAVQTSCRNNIAMLELLYGAARVGCCLDVTFSDMINCLYCNK